MDHAPLTHRRAVSPEEKDEVLERLRLLWQANPELRLMQLIENVFRGRSAYAIEDYDAIAMLEGAYRGASPLPQPDHEVTVVASYQNREIRLEMYCPPPCNWECTIAEEDGTPKTYASLSEMARLAAECHAPQA